MNNKNSGLSLVELVCAVAILSTSVLMLISCFHGLSQIRSKTLVYSNMQMVCKNVFEEIRATNEIPTVNYAYVYDGLSLSIVLKSHENTESMTTSDISYYEVTFYSDDLGNSGYKKYKFIVPSESAGP